MVAPEAVKQFGDLSDWKNAIGTGPFMLAGDKYLAEKKMPSSIYLGTSGLAIEDEEKRSERFMSRQEFQWQRQIKEILDPNKVGDGCYYWGKKPEK